MGKKVCPNGHVYDPAIYGDQCPMCPPVGVNAPAGANATGIDAGPATQLGDGGFNTQSGAAMHTRVATPQMNNMQQPMYNQQSQQAGPNGETMVRPQNMEPQQPAQRSAGGHTVIRRPGMNGGPSQASSGRKLVGFLVTYNRDPMGKAYNLYEGRNYIGRDHSCDVCVNEDTQMSGRHMSILYRNVDNKFKFRDEQSSNGTFINKELMDDGELQNYDIIRVGSTLFIFIAIPKIGQ